MAKCQWYTTFCVKKLKYLYGCRLDNRITNICSLISNLHIQKLKIMFKVLYILKKNDLEEKNSKPCSKKLQSLGKYIYMN